MLELFWPDVCVGCGIRRRGRLCDGCAPRRLRRASLEIPGVEAIWIAGAYRGPLGRILRQAKTRPDRSLMVLLARTLMPLLPDHLDVDAVVAVPSPWIRKLRRGYSGPHILAHAIGRALGVRVADGLRVTDGPRQSEMARRERRTNLRGRYHATGCVNGHVLLVDDVVTTGATMMHCTRELMGGTTRRVTGVAVCVSGEDECFARHVEGSVQIL